MIYLFTDFFSKRFCERILRNILKGYSNCQARTSIFLLNECDSVATPFEYVLQILSMTFNLIPLSNIDKMLTKVRTRYLTR